MGHLKPCRTKPTANIAELQKQQRPVETGRYAYTMLLIGQALLLLLLDL